jgi:RNA polymerase sigma-B factor
LIESHLPLVRAIARRYAGRGEALDDLVQVGALGLIRASDRFDPDRGVAFATFAAPAVEGEIRRHLGDRTRPLRIPRELQRMTGQLQRRRAELLASSGREPSVGELATALGAEREDVEAALEAARARDSRSEPAAVDDVAGNYEFGATSDDRLLLARGARVLDKRERRIVFLRFHADMTERDIASEVGISQAHVSRLLAGALAKLRQELEDQDSGSGEADAAGSTTPAAHPDAQMRPRDLERQDRHWRTGAGSSLHRMGAPEEQAEPTRASAPEGPARRPKQRAGRREARSGPSGRFLVRMPSMLHQQLTEAAERDQVSLNRYVNQTLAASLTTPASGPVAGGRVAEEENEGSPVPQRRSFRMLLAANVIVMVVAAAAAIVLLILAVQQGL